MKRFTETNKWEDPWFRKLKPEMKLLWSWLLDSCDNAGIIDADIELAAFQIGYPYPMNTLSEFVHRVIKLPCGKFFIPKFIEFQYGSLSRDCKAHNPVFLSLEKHGLKGYPKGIHTLQEKDKDKDKEKDKETETEKEADAFPFSSPEFAKAWEDWQEHRKEIKKPLKPTQIEKQLEELQSIGEQRAIAMINHTIAKGWQGLREPESNPRGEADHPRCAEFLSIFTDCYQAFTSSAYPLGDNDRAALIRLLRAIPDLTTEEFRDNIEGCQRAAVNEGKFANKILTHTGNLAAFCSNWSGIVASSQTYQESKK